MVLKGEGGAVILHFVCLTKLMNLVRKGTECDSTLVASPL